MYISFYVFYSSVWHIILLLFCDPFLQTLDCEDNLPVYLLRKELNVLLRLAFGRAYDGTGHTSSPTPERGKVCF